MCADECEDDRDLIVIHTADFNPKGSFIGGPHSPHMLKNDEERKEPALGNDRFGN